jgi:hypothetical protein
MRNIERGLSNQDGEGATQARLVKPKPSAKVRFLVLARHCGLRVDPEALIAISQAASLRPFTKPFRLLEKGPESTASS